MKKFLLSIFFCSLNLLIGAYDYVHRYGFQNYADFLYDNTDDPQSIKRGGCTFDPDKVADDNVIFIRRMCLDDFFIKMHPKIKSKYILITHIDDGAVPLANTQDFPTGYMKFLNDPKLIAWFGINPSIRHHPKFFPIPIGINQGQSFYDDRKQYFEFFEHLKNTIPKTKLLYMNFTVWTCPWERGKVKKQFINKRYCFNRDGGLNFEEYIKEMAQYKFVLAPRGNGLDCYRTWEAILVGCIPVIRSSYLDPLLEGLPVLIVKDWEMVTEKFLNEKYRQMGMKTYSLEKIGIDYWLSKIKIKKKNNT